jgi:hypothetical protein
VYANIARQNSEFRHLMPGDEGSKKGVVLFVAWTALSSLNHEIGPISEASIGNIGMDKPDQQGWVDPVITTTLGTAWMVMEDYVHKNVLSRIRGEKTRAFWHVLLNPARSTANVFAGRIAWAG